MQKTKKYSYIIELVNKVIQQRFCSMVNTQKHFISMYKQAENEILKKIPFVRHQKNKTVNAKE